MTSDTLDLQACLAQIRRLIPEGNAIYLVGGAVRDAMLGKPLHDLDFTVEHHARAAARHVADSLNAAYYALDVERDTGRVVDIQPDGSRLVLDFSLMQGGDINSDLSARDFTINAMALDLRAPDQLIDPLGGAADLHSRQIRLCSPTAFEDDPVRILRGIRLASGLGYRLLPETLQHLRQALPGLPAVSPERLRDELFRILEGPAPGTALRVMEKLSVMPGVLPELPALKGVTQPAPHVYDAWEHTLATVEKLQSVWAVLDVGGVPDEAANLMMGLLSLRLGRYREQVHEHYAARLNPHRSLKGLVTLAALYHDAAKPETGSYDDSGELHFYDHDQAGALLIRRRLTELHLSNDEIERAESIVRRHMRPLLLGQAGELPTRRAIYRYFRDTGSAGVDICCLSMADFLATYGPTVSQDAWDHHLDVVRLLFSAWWEKQAEIVAPPALINGNTLMERFSLAPGPQIGKLLESVREAQATGQVSSLDEAFNWVESLLEKGI
jgi:tRNA nucleotidyltransferase/poly(A) polymerase